MKNSSFLKILGFALFCFGIGTGGAFAQTPSTLQVKQQQQQMSGMNYDAWKASSTNAVTRPNKVLYESVQEEKTSFYIRLGFDILDAEAEKVYEKKLLAQPGFYSADADYKTNTIEIVIKTADEHETLKKCFDID